MRAARWIGLARFIEQTVLLEFVLECAAADAQDLRRFFAVVRHVSQGLPDKQLFHFGQRHPRPERERRRLLIVRAQEVREVGHLDG